MIGAASQRRLSTILLPALTLLVLAAVAGLLWLPADPAQAQTEQSERPTITAGPAITSSPARGDTYGKGEAIQVAVTFSEAVTVTGEPRVRLTIGERTRWARYDSSSSDGTVLTFDYTVKDHDQDENGISIKKNQLELRDGTIADADGNAAKLKHPALPDQSGHKVDGTPPFINAGPVIVSSPTSGDAYGEGEAIVVAVTFSEAVTVTGQPRVRLTVGERQRWARYDHSRQEGTVLFFAYQVKKVDADPDGVSIAANQLLLRGGSIEDARGNAADLEHSALPDQSGHKVDGSKGKEQGSQDSPGGADQAGVVSLDFDTGRPEVGGELRAFLLDPDGGVSGLAWSWARSEDGTTAWEAISGATGSSYTATEDDAGHYLRATAAYADGHGPGKTAQRVTDDPVLASQDPAQPQAPPDNTPPTYTIEYFQINHYGGDASRIYPPDGSGAVGWFSNFHARVVFDEPIDKSQTTIMWRIGSGAERSQSIHPACRPTSSTTHFACSPKKVAGESGLLQLRVSAYKDTQGNAGVAGSYNTWGLTVDFIPPEGAPTLVLKTPVESAYRPVFIATPSETGGKVYLHDGDGCNQGRGSSQDVWGFAQIEITAPEIPKAERGGPVTYYAHQRDHLGNQGPCSTAFEYADSRAPDPAANLSATRGAGRITLTWDRPDPEDPPIVKYQYRQRSLDVSYPEAWTDIPGSGPATTSHTVTGLDDGDSYAFQVRAVDTLHQGAAREVVMLAEIPADSPLMPGDIQPGQRFRLLFVTSDKRNASSGSINDYNAFVQAAAARNPRLAAYSSAFKALLSTSGISARQNTQTGPERDFFVAGEGVPIYWLGGEKVADFNADLYDRSWDSIAAKNEQGEDSDATDVWTGSTADGITHRVDFPGGRSGNVRTGRLGGKYAATTRMLGPVQARWEGNPFSASRLGNSSLLPIYALSPVLTAGAPRATAAGPVAVVTSTPACGDRYRAEFVTPEPSVQPTACQQRYLAAGNTLPEVIRFALTFAEKVTVDAANPPGLVFDLGGGERLAGYQSGSGSETLVFTYTVRAGDRDEDGIRIDGLRTPAASSIRGRGAVSAAIQQGKGIHTAHKVGAAIKPRIAWVGLRTRPAQYATEDDSDHTHGDPLLHVAYGRGESIVFVVYFDRPVAVYEFDRSRTGSYPYYELTPRMKVTAGSMELWAEYWKGSGTSALYFIVKLPLTGSDSSGSQGISIPADPFEIRRCRWEPSPFGGQYLLCSEVPIYDPATGAAADLTMAAQDPYLYSRVDRTKDYIAAANVGQLQRGWERSGGPIYGIYPSSGPFYLDDVIEIDAQFNVTGGRTLHVEGNPTIDINVGGKIRQAIGRRVVNGNRVVFTYNVTEDDYAPVSIGAERGLIHMDRNNYIYTEPSTGFPTVGDTGRKRTDAEHEGLPWSYEGTLSDPRFAYRVDGLRDWHLKAKRNSGGSIVRDQDGYPVYEKDGPRPAPLAPANLRAIPGNGQVDLLWDTPTSSVKIVSYLVWREDDPHWREIGVVNRYRVEGLTNGELYRFRVRARGGDQNGRANGRGGAVAGPVEARPQRWLLNPANQAPRFLEHVNYAGDMNLYQYKERYTNDAEGRVWSAALTVDADGAYYGCDNTADANTPDRCSAPSVLTDGDFVHGNRPYTIDEALWHNPSTQSPDRHDFRLKFDSRETGEQIQTALERLRLVVGATHLDIDEALAGVDVDSKPTLTWKDINLGWTDGQKVSLALAARHSEVLRRTGVVIARMGKVFHDPDGDQLTYRVWRQDGSLHWQDQYQTYGAAFVIDAEGNIRTTSDTRYFLGEFQQPPRNSDFVLCVEAKDPAGATATRCITFDASDKDWPRRD